MVHIHWRCHFFVAIALQSYDINQDSEIRYHFQLESFRVYSQPQVAAREQLSILFQANSDSRLESSGKGLLRVQAVCTCRVEFQLWSVMFGATQLQIGLQYQSWDELGHLIQL